jgi:hypothetical protein
MGVKIDQDSEVGEYDSAMQTLLQRTRRPFTPIFTASYRRVVASSRAIGCGAGRERTLPR